MKTKHTPGDWKINSITLHKGQENIIDDNGQFIAHIDDRPTKEETLANAKIIQAVPDMLIALMVAKAHLEYAIKYGCGAGGETKAIMIIDRAIKRATE